jgi:hypothetical protein
MTTHGKSGSPEHRIWLAMRSRCRPVSEGGHERYGGRGISVCERWAGLFDSFLEDMGERPSDKHSIDRIDNDGDYEPGNCRWATSAEQSRNTSVNRMVTHDGETLCIADWAERYGLRPSMLSGRLNAGWDFERAVTTPSRRGDDAAFLQTPISDRDAEWYREYDRRGLGIDG